ncbi:response regulator [Candidatus Parabeggiatoa sp. HSG14]|uniref:response regulator n=1 Tax=Candidatus Parabeggiatoa sp. HSG14 TaxID=3055593 RepID=UPI0025A8CADB|nr:response regulator [Thiotrichales bacterium HSG14]
MLNTKPITLLIVDDNKNNLFTLRTLIKEYLDVQIEEADSGLAALKIISKQTVDLIILDVQMPDMDGFETAQAIRSRPKTQHIPIVFLTAAYKTEEFQQKGFAIGAADYLMKPIDTTQLITRIKSYLRFIEQDRLHKINLENRVEERTAELLGANKSLKQEITERQKIERTLKQEITERQQIELALKQEIVERQQIEKALQEVSEASEAANLAKSQFMANMSHELRTPLNAIIGYSEMLKEEAEELEPNEFVPDLQKIHSAGKHLLGLINDVLDLSKIEAGKMDLFIESVDLEILLDEVVNTVQPLVEKKTNVLKIKSPDVLGEMKTDLTKLRQMLLNLISNAAKFTEQGIINLTIDRKTKEDGEWITLCVADNGIGMSDEQQQKLFQPFTQADTSTTRRYGGTGLGLAITKQFSEMMGGTIKVESEFGKGSTFTLSLPVQAKVTPIVSPPTEPESSLLEVEGDGIVLIIDDDAIIRQSLKEKLSKLGYAVAVATNKDEGINLAYKLRPDAIIVSTQMSNMAGWEILSTLKNDSLMTNIPMIIISMEKDKEKGYAMGAKEHIDKAIKPRQLAAILEKYHVGDDSTNLVMIVDDEEIFREGTSMILESQGWRVFQAENGQVALDHLDDKKPSLIMLDLNMPVMNGFKFLTHLQENENWCSIPVIILTAEILSAEQEAQLNLQVETVFKKDTLNQDDLIVSLHNLISDATEYKVPEEPNRHWE